MLQELLHLYLVYETEEEGLDSGFEDESRQKKNKIKNAMTFNKILAKLTFFFLS